MDAGKKERYIELIGNLKQRRKATELIVKIATFCREDNGKVLKDGQVGGGGGGSADSIVIQSGEVGKVLGRGGENIRRIEEESGARLELDRNEGRLDIRGPPDAVAKAREMVLSEVSHARDGLGAVIKDSQGGGGQRGPGGDMRGGKGGGGGGDSGAPMVVFVRGNEAGRIIGRGGETVRDMMSRTGAEIKVERSDRHDSEREIKIFGTAAQKEEALLGIGNTRDVTYIRSEQGVIRFPEMSPPEADAALRRFANGGMPPPWGMGGPMGMMPPPGMMPGMPGMPPMMMPPHGMPGMPGMPPPHMFPHGMPPMEGMMPPGGKPGRSRAGRSSSSSSSSSSGKRKRARGKGDPMADFWQSSQPGAAQQISFPTPWNEEKKSIDWDEL